MAEIIVRLTGDIEFLQRGITALARDAGWQLGSTDEPLPNAKNALGLILRDRVTYWAEKDAADATQADVNDAIARQQSTLAQTREDTIVVLDAITLSVELLHQGE